MQIASHFFALLKMADMMVEEFKSEFPGQLDSDINTRMALQSGFKAYKSEALDYYLEHHDKYPLTLVLFYDSSQMNDVVMRKLSTKVLDVFVLKYEHKFSKGNFNVGQSFFSGVGSQQQATKFDFFLSVIYEEVSAFPLNNF